MPPRRSAGLLLYRRAGAGVEVLLAHMGGPLWASKDERAWSLPKGEYDSGEYDSGASDSGEYDSGEFDGAEEPYAAARREFTEELGHPPPDGDPLPLGEVRQANGKIVTAWALLGDLDVETVHSNHVELEWPPRSGRMQRFPEIDRAAWFAPDIARVKLITAQAAFVDRLVQALDDLPQYGVSHAMSGPQEDPT